MKLITATAFLLICYTPFAQNVGIGTPTPDANAILELSSSSKGFLMPRISDANMNAMVSPLPGMMLYNSNQGRPYMYVGTWKKMMLEGDPFTLPYAGSGNTSSILFNITQNGPGPVATAIFGTNSQNGRGVAGTSESGNGIYGTSNTGIGGYFATTSGKALVATGEVVLNNGYGKTMIGNLSTPQMQLHINDASDTALLLMDNNTALATGTNAGMYFKNGNWYTGAIKAIGTGSNVARLGFYTFASSSQNGLLERLSILDNGNIGINNNNPSNKLDVSGTFRATGNAVIGGTLQIQGGSPGLGKVLTSDASGNATWSGAVNFAAYKTPSPSGTTVNGSSSVTVAFDVEDFDSGPGSLYSNATNAFTAPVSGVYHFDVSVSVSPQVTGQSMRVRLTKNGSINIRDVSVETQNLFSPYSIPLSADVSLAAGDQISVSFINFSSSTVIINGQSTSSGPATTYFNGHLIR